ncbi:energy-coupling factor ABC transporter ATP-binding protein [bacterium]|nr:energy-coupling factor ABC transporter ATP-binding protein [bacterium]
MTKIAIKGLSHLYPDGHCGIRNINLQIQPGELVVIAGQNGSGKTTLCKHINGLLKPTSGNVFIGDLQVDRNPSKARQLVGMVFQNADSQIVGETVSSDIAFGPENLGLKRAEINARVKKIIQIVGLDGKEDNSPHTLSGGEKRKLAIAGVLAMNPEIIIFDEPFANLDYPGSVQILDQIVMLHQTQRTIIIITHELEKIISLASRLVILKDGELAKEGIPSTIIKDVEQFGIREPCSSKLGYGLQSWRN